MHDHETATEMIPAVKNETEETRGFFTRRTLWIFAAVCIVALLTGATVAVLQGISSYHQTVFNSGPAAKKIVARPPSPAVVTPTPVKGFAKPVKAAVIAREASCWKFRDIGPAASGMVYDSGVCFKGGRKYGLDTFRTQAARNAWIKMAAKFGVNPKWETNTSVIYPSVNPNS